MALNDEIDKLLIDFAEVTVNDVRANLDKAVNYGGNPSRLSAKINYIPPTNLGDKIVLQIIMPDYGFVLDKGRNAGNVSKEGVESIEKWIKRRGLTPKMSKKRTELVRNRKTPKPVKQQNREKAVKQFAFAIAKKIKQKGHAQPYKEQKLGFWSKVINDGRIEELQNRISEIVKTDIIIQINNGINN